MWKSLWTIVLVAVLLRFAARLNTGAADFWENGYTFYFQLAQNVAAGNGLGFDGQHPTAFRVPIYPMFLAAVTLGHKAFFSVVFAQSLIGASTVLCGALLTAELFGFTAGITTAALAAAYPYYVVHDTALQETSLFTFLTLLSVLLLIRVRRSMSGVLATLAGFALGAAVLTRATIAPFAVVAPMWLGWAGAGSQRVRAALLCAGALALTLAPWLVRAALITGSPVLSTETGLQLWDGNNPHTFDHYPLESIDVSHAAALDSLSANERAELDMVGSDAMLVDRWFLQKALVFIGDNPWLTVGNGFRKIGAAFSWLPSPRRSFWSSLIYTTTYAPLTILGLLGMILTWRSWREHSIIYALFLSFVVITAVFFGHTSHRSFLDVYWMAYASSVLTRWPWRQSTVPA